MPCDCEADLCALQIVMTANTAVLCYVASPRTPQEHAAVSTVRQLLVLCDCVPLMLKQTLLYAIS